LEFSHWNLGFASCLQLVRLVLQKSIMQYLKNALFVAMFALLSFGLEAATPLTTFSTQTITVDAPQSDGVVIITQGRRAVRVEILVPGRVRLVVRDDAGTVVYRRWVRPALRNVRINTEAFADGTYMLTAISSVGNEDVTFTIESEE